jgi:tRNA(Ile)-lysidine synthase
LNAALPETLASGPVSAAEAAELFAPLASETSLVIAVSGGPDSVALLALLAEWAIGGSPGLHAVTVDHGLRPQASEEALGVGRLCAELGVPHAIRIWDGEKPRTGLQEQARAARYRLLQEEARRHKAAIVTAHTLDDQAETLLLRMAAGSGLTGLAGMAARAQLGDTAVIRPLLGVEKRRLVATCRARGLGFVQDPSNEDPRFARVRWRGLMPMLAGEGLNPRRLAMLAGRFARADRALEARARQVLAECSSPAEGGEVRLDLAALAREPEEIAIRVLGLALERAGEGREAGRAALRLARLEDCAAALLGAVREGRALRRTLAGFRLGLSGGGMLTLLREGERRRGVHPAVE